MAAESRVPADAHPREVLEFVLDAVNEKDWDAVAERVDDDVIVRRPFMDLGVNAPRTFAGEWRGRDAVRELLEDLSDELNGFHVTLRGAEDLPGGRLLAEILYRIGPENQAAYQVVWGIYGFRDGRIASSETFATERDARAELARRTEGGVSP